MQDKKNGMRENVIAAVETFVPNLKLMTLLL